MEDEKDEPLDGIDIESEAAAPELPKPKKPVKAKKVEPYAVVGKGKTDPIYLSQMVYENPKTRKSLSVHHLQRRLTELGHGEAGADIDGRYGALTKAAVSDFQAATGLEVTGIVDSKTFEQIFEGDPNVTLFYT